MMVVRQHPLEFGRFQPVVWMGWLASDRMMPAGLPGDLDGGYSKSLSGGWPFEMWSQLGHLGRRSWAKGFFFGGMIVYVNLYNQLVVVERSNESFHSYWFLNPFFFFRLWLRGCMCHQGRQMKNRKEQEQPHNRRSWEQVGALNKGSIQMRVAGTTDLGKWNIFTAKISTHTHIHII